MLNPARRFPAARPPEREPDDRTSAERLGETGVQHHLKQFLGNQDTTIVSREKYITARRGGAMKYPDLMVAFMVDPAAYRETNGYVISEQGKPPDLVLEIASKATSRMDVREKREFYQRLLIPEYLRFDATGEFHGARLAGDRLVNGWYQPTNQRLRQTAPQAGKLRHAAMVSGRRHRISTLHSGDTNAVQRTIAAHHAVSDQRYAVHHARIGLRPPLENDKTGMRPRLPGLRLIISSIPSCFQYQETRCQGRKTVPPRQPVAP